tara:strand:+ start:777 stop:944 length:168 start_codon:yes stop_codon:yes gene_type:complete
MHFNKIRLAQRSLDQQLMSGVKSVKRSTDEASAKRTVRLHDGLLKHKAFDDIASI